MVARSPHPVWLRSSEALKSVIQIAKAGTRCRELLGLVEENIKPYGPHPMTAGNLGNSIGCFLEEAPQLSATGDAQLEAGCVYTLRAGASDGRDYHAIASAMISIQPQGSEVLWSVD